MIIDHKGVVMAFPKFILSYQLDLLTLDIAYLEHLLWMYCLIKHLSVDKGKLYLIGTVCLVLE